MAPWYESVAPLAWTMPVIEVPYYCNAATVSLSATGSALPLALASLISELNLCIICTNSALYEHSS